MTEEEIGKAMKEMAKLERDKQRKMLHGTSKSITAENKFRLLKNNGKRNGEETINKTDTSRKNIKLKASSSIRIP
ncbi:hypothetical protein [uncultured Mediterranean phage uvMED]|nr:hypothetical protein [Synechococcus sp. AH-601-C19]BAQ89681.1 hypothetical protein [uncultured Mediterranean phage uvMED]BAQ89724.1 hypothetical protein [uncultured Mediterranean phage uvMED]BAQ89817.1 hypothetical protein [uncultured Mediterranean phage uvMED]BAR19183.1 hypothetical protein [uncultured Mediterranean phage uvMED]|tara:strand:- start:864 stop:1088 length:225 start_codon:yes stop_codon:yes gene_type:complete